MDAATRAADMFAREFGEDPEFIVRAPGRVNLIGEHTDYNEGFALPMGLPFDTVIAGRHTVDGVTEVVSEGYGRARFEADADPATSTGWVRYVHGAGHLLAASGTAVMSWQGTIASDIPHGASLSSSAALEVAALLAFAGFDVDRSLTPQRIAEIGQRVENEIVGVPCGRMDQLTSASAVEGHAILMDCRDDSVRPIALDEGVAIVLMDTGTRRQLVDSEYAERRRSCERTAAALGVAALRDAELERTLELLATMPVDARRARHIVTENARTLEAADALQAGDVGRFGELMNASHESLRDDFEVSGPALDLVVELARATTGCLGARMTGGGFAGGAVALVLRESAEQFVSSMSERFHAPRSQPASGAATFAVVRASAGAEIVRYGVGSTGSSDGGCHA